MIFEKYSYKNKFTALIVIFAMLSYTAYKRSFSSLINIIKENKELTQNVKKLNDSSKNINKITSNLAAIDKIIGKESIDKETIQQDVISYIALHRGKVSIYSMQPVHEYRDGSHTIYTNRLDVTGNVDQLLSLAYDFEKNFNYSKLVSVKFYTIKKNNNPDVLHLQMIFQNYENNK